MTKIVCEQPGLWWIAGIQVRRVGRGRWVIVWEPGVRFEVVSTFVEAKARVVATKKEGA